MELKEMPETGVVLNTGEEARNFFALVSKAEWVPILVHEDIVTGIFDEFPVAIKCTQQMSWTDKKNLSWYGRSINVSEFKKEQGIMKYESEDVLENPDGYTRKVLGVCGLAYIMSSCDSFDEGNNDSIFTESQLDGLKYAIKIDKTAKTDMTVSQLEVAAGLQAGSLNVVAEK